MRTNEHKVFLEGNDAIVAGAMAAGAKFYAGYPNVIQVAGKTLLHVGDTMLDPAYDYIAETYQIDLAMLPLWGKGMGSDESTAVSNMTTIVNKLKPKYVMFHNRWDPNRPAWNAFFKATEGIEFATTFLDQHPGVSVDL